MQLLSEILKSVKFIETNGNRDINISSLEYDSRNVKKGSLFFATDGVHSDGHNYIKSAIDSGAIAICYSKKDIEFYPNVCYIRVENPRLSMSEFSNVFYDYPSKNIKVIGVTGTDGKSTTVSLIYQLLTLCGKSAGFISTVEYKAGDKIKPNPYRQSTPEATEINKLLAEMVQNKNEYAVIETTSHGLSKKNNRVGDIKFSAGVFTNVTQEHLEFHKTIEQYRSDKANLFRMLDKNSYAIINIDDPNSKLYLDASDCEIITYSTKDKYATIFAKDIEATNSGLSININNIKCSINLVGTFNVYNVMATIGVVFSCCKISLKEILKHISKLEPINGRMNLIDCGQDFKVIIDYAHTPGAFESILPDIKKQCKKRVITVFGSAGERDKVKRAIQGEIADRYSDIIILTDEDPRLEDREKILEDIATGIKNKKNNNTLFKIPDREEAIKKAISLAEKNDTVILLGKGHESSIIYKDKKLYWNEKETTIKILQNKK